MFVQQDTTFEGRSGATGRKKRDLDGRTAHSCNSRPIVRQAPSEGYNYSFTFSLERPTPELGFGGMLAYTFSDAFNVTDATSSRAISMYHNTVRFDYNDPELARSCFITRHRMLANVNYALDIGPAATVLSMIYEGRSGQPYSYTFTGYVANVGNNFIHLIFVPENETEHLPGVEELG